MNKSQKNIFLYSEGNQWYQRNKEKIGALDKASHDEILKCIEYTALPITTVLEIGCADGWRLHAIHQKYKAKCFGIEPSGKAVAVGKKQFPHLQLQKGTADNLPWGGYI